MGVRAIGFGLKDPPDCTRLLIVLQTIFFPFNYFRMSFLVRLFYSTLRIRLGCCGGWLCRVLWRRCAHTRRISFQSCRKPLCRNWEGEDCLITLEILLLQNLVGKQQEPCRSPAHEEFADLIPNNLQKLFFLHIPIIQFGGISLCITNTMNLLK